MPVRPARKKVRCPKCTALFSEPSKAMFECPICSCCLSANGAIAVADSRSNQENPRDSGQTEIPNKAEEASRGQSQQECFNDVIDSQQNTRPELREVSGRDSSTQIHKEEELPVDQIKTLPFVFNEEDKEERPSADGAFENPYNIKDVTEMDYTESNSAPVKTGESNEEDSALKKGGSINNKQLQLQMFQATGGEFSFKYSLEGALQSESENYNRRLTSSKLSELVKAPKTDTSDESFHSPLRVRIVNSRDESSDQSEHGRYSFDSDTDSQDGSESEFDFPAPWAEGPQVSKQGDSSAADELSQCQSRQTIPATPHQLELLDDHDTSTYDVYSLQDSSKLHEGCEIAIPSLMADNSKDLFFRETENKLRDGVEISNDKIANLMTSAAFDVAISTENGSMQGFGSQGGQEELSGVDDKHKSLDSSTNSVREVSASASDLQLIAQSNQTDECTNVEIAKASEFSRPLQAFSSNISPPSTAVAISSSTQDAAYLFGVPSVNEARSSAQICQPGLGFQTLELEDGSEMTLPRTNRGNFSPVLEGHLNDDLMLNSGKDPHACVKPNARSKRTIDYHLQQETEVQLDLYSHQEVDEWQSKKEPIGNDASLPNSVLHLDAQNLEEQSSSLSGYAPKSVSVASFQHYGFSNNQVSDHFSNGAMSSSPLYTYQVPSQAMIVPTAISNQSMAPFGYHLVSNTCLMCSHHHHPLMQVHSPPHCVHWNSHCGCVACNLGCSSHLNCHQLQHHPEPALTHLNCCQPSHHPAPVFTSSLQVGTPAPSNPGQRHGFSRTNLRSQASSSTKVSGYPPFPQDGATPYFACKGCNRVLQVPLDLPPISGVFQKLRCSACGRVTKFSVKQRAKLRQVYSSSSSPQTQSIGALPLDHYTTHSMASSHGANMPNLSSPRTQAENSSQLLAQVEGDLYSLRLSDVRLQDGDYLRGRSKANALVNPMSSNPRYLENGAGVNGVMGPRDKVLGSTDRADFERTGQHAVASIHVAVDEKDEGLDFGAPRISDGDSFDHSESTTRSPEGVQTQRTCGEIPEGVPLGGPFPEDDWSEEDLQGKKPGSPLIELLNQESTRFELTLHPKAPYDEPGSASLSPASDPPMVDSAKGRDRKKWNFSQSRGSAAHRGPKYIARLLRRSLRDISEGGH